MHTDITFINSEPTLKRKHDEISKVDEKSQTTPVSVKLEETTSSPALDNIWDNVEFTNISTELPVDVLLPSPEMFTTSRQTPCYTIRYSSSSISMNKQRGRFDPIEHSQQVVNLDDTFLHFSSPIFKHSDHPSLDEISKI